MKGVECGDRGKSVSMTAVLPSMIVLVEVLSCKEGYLFKSPGVCTLSEMEHWPVSDIEMGLFTQLWNHLSQPCLPSLFWLMIMPDLTERTSWTEPWGRAFWENGVTFDVARPQSFWTYLGCSKKAYSASISCSIYYQWTWSCSVRGMRLQCPKDNPFTYFEFLQGGAGLLFKQGEATQGNEIRWINWSSLIKSNY